MKDLIVAILKLTWLIISNTYVLPFIIVGAIMSISRIFGFWYGKRGGAILYATISMVLGIILNWNVIMRLFK